MSLRNLTTLAAIAIAAGLAGCYQSVGPGGVRQDAGPFHQSVGPGGVEQRVDPPGRRPPPPGASCRIECRGKTYAVDCPRDLEPECQCQEKPYAACVEP